MPPDPLHPDPDDHPDTEPDPVAGGRPAAHPDLAAEQAVVAAAYVALGAMAERAGAALAAARRAGDAGEVDGSIAAGHLAQRVRHLDPDVPGLVFGRLDGEDASRWYVGRRHVEDGAGDPLVVDWRAPVSVPFYRATPVDPQGLARRRRFLTEARTVVELFDDDFADADLAAEVRAAGIPDPLLAELERSRTGAMRDIVATIAAEQDEVIRAPLGTCLVVQGGPGTGKTAVGLHRAAYLLYEHRAELERDGVLIVGPNPVFLRYISAVLPSLGETATRQSTVARLVSGGVGGRVRALDAPERAALLGDRRMAEVLARAVTGQRRRAEDDLQVSTPWGRVVLPADEVQATLDEVAGRDAPWAVRRGAVRHLLVRQVVARHVARKGEASGPAAELDAAVRGSEELNRAVARLWPSPSAPTLARRLLTSRAALGRAADGILSSEEQALVRRAAAASLKEETWTVAEAVLVDEAAGLIDGVSTTYGHVVVDEAQDLTAMGLRALARRCPTRSMTVLGDLAQATEPGATASWAQALAELGATEADPDDRRDGAGATPVVVELTLGYRVPHAVMRLADRLLPRAAPGVAPTRSVRTGGRDPRVIDVGGPGVGGPTADGPREVGADGGPRERLVARVVAEVGRLSGRWGSVGLVVPPLDTPAGPLADALEQALLHAGHSPGRGARAVGDAELGLVTPAEAKGLEFDAVVVVEPAAFALGALDPAAAGRLLYVALTRAVQELVVVHATSLPSDLVGDDAGVGRRPDRDSGERPPGPR